MAERTPLEARPGRQSGRIAPTGWVAPGGEYVWCLGSDSPGYRASVVPGDEVSVAQSGEYAPACLLRLRGRLRGPAEGPLAGWSWEAFASVDGVEVWSRALRAGVAVDVADLGLSLLAAAAPADVVFGLRVLGPALADAVELEVPAFYLDALVLDGDAVADVVNAAPAAGEVQVPPATSVGFDFFYSTGELPADVLAGVDVRVDGVSAVSGGVAQAGYSLADSNPVAGVLRLAVGLPVGLASKQVVAVRVVHAGLGVDVSYSFTAEDSEGPVLLSALPTGQRALTLRFDEELAAVQAADFSVSRQTVPAVGVAVVAATLGAERDSVALRFDTEVTAGAGYRVSTAVADAWGNAGGGTADFEGYRPPAPEGRDFDLYSMLPEAVRVADETEDLKNFLACLQDVVGLLLYDVDRWPRIVDLELCPESFLDALLWQLGYPFDFALSALEKRRLLRVLVELYRRKGTKLGIQAVARLFVGVEVEVVALAEGNWVLGESELGEETVLGPSRRRDKYTFEVLVPRALTVVERERLTAVVQYAKPAHTHFRLVEPVVPEVVDHVELGLSLLGVEWELH